MSYSFPVGPVVTSDVSCSKGSTVDTLLIIKDDTIEIGELREV